MTTTVSYLYSSGLDCGRKAGHNHAKKQEIFTITSEKPGVVNGHKIGFAEDSLRKLEQRHGGRQNNSSRASRDLYACVSPFLIFGKLFDLYQVKVFFKVM